MRVGSLFSGYGGLDLAVGGELAWYSEVDPAACRVLEAHHSSVPNIGDVTQYGDCTCGDVIPWDHLPPVDVITAGYPCQPFSQAGQRNGTEDERHLWPYVRDAILALRPVVTVLENVDGHRSLGLDVVLGDIADMGMSARWGVVRAADAGAPHGRKRVFITVTDPTRRAGREGQGWGLSQSEGAAGLAAHAGVIAAYSDSSSGEAWEHTRYDSGRLRVQPMGPSTPTPWGKYQQAIERWESVVGRRAPAPTVEDARGRPRLNSVFVEWMMGLAEGWVTGHGLTRSQELKMLGNGVCPQQASLAMQLLGGPR